MGKKVNFARRPLAILLALVMVLGMATPAMAATATYTVEHYLQKLDGTYPAAADYTKTESGTAGKIVAASAKTYPGYTATTLPADVLAEDGSTVLKVYYTRNQYAVYFDTAGGNYMAPFSVKYEGSLSVSTPTRDGYTFTGWTITCDDTNSYSSVPATMPAGNLYLEANWTADANASSYTIVYWLENANNSDNSDPVYDYVGSVTATGTAGDAVVVPSDESGVTFPIASTYYTRNATRTAAANQTLTIAGDGSTIVNVYYDRNEYTIIFNDAGCGLTVGSTTYYYDGSDINTAYTITANYGANIGDLWPTNNPQKAGYVFTWWNDTFSLMFVMDESIFGTASVVTLTAKFDFESYVYPVTLYTIMENANDATNAENEDYRQVISADKSGNNGWYADPIEGFTVTRIYKHSSTNAALDIEGTATTYNGASTFVIRYYYVDGYDEIYMYYARNKWDISFYNGSNGKENDEAGIKYGADISGSYYEPNRPSNVESDYTFGGWYTTEKCLEGSEFDFESTVMPNNNLVLYAKWIAPEFTVTFDINGGTADGASDQTVEKYATAEEPTNVDRGTYTFAGWYEKDAATGELSDLYYEFSFPVTSDITLVAQWKMIYNVHVVVQDTDGNEIVGLPTDDANSTVLVEGGVDENGNPVIVPPYTIPGYEVSEIIDNGDGTLIVIYVPKSEEPVVNPIAEGDETISGTGVPGADITVTFPDDTTASTKVDDNGNWSVLVPDGVVISKDDEIKVTQTEQGKTPSDMEPGTVADNTKTETSDPPVINTIKEGDSTVSGTGVPDSTIVVTFPDGSKETAVVDKSGNWTVTVPDGVTLSANDNVTATQTERGKLVSDPAEKTVTADSSGSYVKPPSSSSSSSSTTTPSAAPTPVTRTSEGYEIGAGSGRSSGNPYDTIVIIGEGDLPLASLNSDDHIKYLNGYPDGSVIAEGAIKRSEAVSIFYRLLKQTHKDGSASTTFSDVPEDAWYSLAVSTLADLGVITGYPDGTFRPDSSMSRAEFAAVASRFDRLILTTGTAFSDVAETHWAVSYINSAYIRGWVDGYSDYTYKPDASMSRAEVVKTVNTMLNRNPTTLPGDINPYNDITQSHWAYIHIMEASIPHDYERDDQGIEVWQTETES